MKRYHVSKKQNQVNEQENLWEAFQNHMDSIYFQGATECLDKKLIAFEYESFKSCFV